MCPTLVVLAQTSFIPAREADAMLRQGPSTVALSTSGTARDLHREQTGLLHAALRDFLDGPA